MATIIIRFKGLLGGERGAWLGDIRRNFHLMGDDFEIIRPQTMTVDGVLTAYEDREQFFVSFTAIPRCVMVPLATHQQHQSPPTPSPQSTSQQPPIIHSPVNFAHQQQLNFQGPSRNITQSHNQQHHRRSSQQSPALQYTPHSPLQSPDPFSPPHTSNYTPNSPPFSPPHTSNYTPSSPPFNHQTAYEDVIILE